MSMLQHQKPQSTPRAAKQGFARETDVNVIVAQARRIGVIPQATVNPPRYVDNQGLEGFHKALTLITRVQQAFDLLPAKIREACGNKPEGYVSLITDKNRREQAIGLGLVKPPPPPKKGEKDPMPEAKKPDEKGDLKK